jgi:hypothetical protein
VAKRVVELATRTYQGFSWQHLTEMLAEREGIDLSHSTLFRILTSAGVAPVRHRRSPKHRSRRERYPSEGMLLQLDASRHDWLGGRGPKLSLVGVRSLLLHQVTMRPRGASPDLRRQQHRAATFDAQNGHFSAGSLGGLPHAYARAA